MLNDDILLSILKNNFDKVITIIDEERPCYVETFDVLTITKDELKNSDTYNFVVDSINLKESDEYILEFGGRIMKSEQSTDSIGNNTIRCIEFYDSYIGHIYVDDTSIVIDETQEYAYNETTAVVSLVEVDLPFEEFTDIKLKKLNIKPLSNDLLEKDLVIQNSISLGRAEDSEIGKYSCAIGDYVTASNYASHAEGNTTTASGEDSHAEGNGTNASGHHSHAEGNSTTASGEDSHAEGSNTTANEYYSHAEGQCTTASGYASHAECNYTVASGGYSHAEGNFTTASGEASHAEGENTTASGKNSHAEGNFTTASSKNSHAEGYNTTTSGESSHAEGHSSNKVTNLISSFSTSTSNDTITTQWGTKKFCLAKGRGSHVEGIDNLALGESSHAEGKCTKSTNMFSHSEGYYSQASGQSSHAEGESTIASGHYSHAEGYTTTASNSSSHAEGFKTTASAYCSHAEGEGTQANGTDSHAEGAQTIANGNYQHVQGRFNIEDNENKYAHIVGNGISNSSRSNGHTLDCDGNAWFKGNVSIDGTPTNDNELVTKKYVDDKITILPLPIYQIQESTTITKLVNIMDLIPGVQYSTYQDINQTKSEGYRVVYVCDDGTFKTICNISVKNKIIHLLKVSHSTNYSTLSYNNIYYKVDYSEHSTNTDIQITKTLQDYLPMNNIIEYNPTKDYDPTTKKYVDDKFIAFDLMETVGTIPQSELQKCNNGTSRYISSIDFDTLFSEPNNYMYYATYKDDTLILIKYDSEYNRMVTNELDSAGSLDVAIGFDYGTHRMYPFNGGNASIKAYTFTNDLIIKRCPIINANIIATKEYVNERVGNSVITVNNVNDSLTLTTDKNQYATLAVPVEIILPTVTSFTELHLFFNGSEGVTIGTTNVKWESQVTIENNKSYEIIFTYVNESIGWLGKTIVYS